MEFSGGFGQSRPVEFEKSRFCTVFLEIKSELFMDYRDFLQKSLNFQITKMVTHQKYQKNGRTSEYCRHFEDFQCVSTTGAE